MAILLSGAVLNLKNISIIQEKETNSGKYLLINNNEPFSNSADTIGYVQNQLWNSNRPFININGEYLILNFIRIRMKSNTEIMIEYYRKFPAELGYCYINFEFAWIKDHKITDINEFLEEAARLLNTLQRERDIVHSKLLRIEQCVENIYDHLLYSPEESGYMEAKTHFESSVAEYMMKKK